METLLSDKLSVKIKRQKSLFFIEFSPACKTNDKKLNQQTDLN